jgi:hypothetical protein
MTDGNGFAFLANGEKPNRIPVMAQTQKTILKLMNWNNEATTESIQEMPLSLKEKLIGTYDDFLYGQGVETKIVERNNRLYVESVILEHFKGKNDNELVYLKNGLFKIIDYPNLLQFDFIDGKATAVKLIRGNMNVEIELIRKEK